MEATCGVFIENKLLTLFRKRSLHLKYDTMSCIIVYHELGITNTQCVRYNIFVNFCLKIISLMIQSLQKSNIFY